MAMQVDFYLHFNYCKAAAYVTGRTSKRVCCESNRPRGDQDGDVERCLWYEFDFMTAHRLISVPFCFLPGIGALVSTLVSTQFAQAERWSFHFLVSLCIAFSNTIFLVAVFGLKTQDGDNLVVFGSLNTSVDLLSLTECLAQIGQAPNERGTSQDSKFRQIFSSKSVHLLAFFILVYVGVEVILWCPKAVNR